MKKSAKKTKLYFVVEVAKYVMLFSASFHMLILFYFTALDRNIERLNIFNILDLELIIPGIEKGFISQVCSVLFVILIATYGYIQVKKKR